MQNRTNSETKTTHHKLTVIVLVVTGLFMVIFLGLALAHELRPLEVVNVQGVAEDLAINTSTNTTDSNIAEVPIELPLDKPDYATRMLRLANNSLFALLSDSSMEVVATSTGSTTTELIEAEDPEELYASHNKRWPAEDGYPEVGAILPFHRIIAYYGNFYSRQMGALGEYEPEEVKERLLAEVANWEAADPSTPVMPAIDYIAVVAQADAGRDGMYRNRMPDSEIQKAVDLARELEGIVFLEIQAGLSDLQVEIEYFEKWLKLPEVHLAIDPEFRMKNGNQPGRVIGMVDAVDVNLTIEYLDKLVEAGGLPPKILIVHRFTQNMVTNATAIKPSPTTQVVMVMDGWGPQANKIGTYYHVVEPEPVQFTGFKVFYKNDLKPPSTGLMSPKDILDLSPRPIFIQYQ